MGDDGVGRIVAVVRVEVAVRDSVKRAERPDAFCGFDIGIRKRLKPRPQSHEVGAMGLYVRFETTFAAFAAVVFG